MIHLNCLIVEDEPLAAEILEDYVQQVPFLKTQNVCHQAIDAIAEIKSKKPDVLFLDLHLPGMKGFDFLRTLPYPLQTIVTTAYHQYALEGYELNIKDYLMKPIEFSRFLTAVNKLDMPSSNHFSGAESNQLIEERPIYITENRKQVRLLPSEIQFFESQKDYIVLSTSRGEIRTKCTLGKMLENMPNEQFLRIHRSFVVSIKAVSSFSAIEVMVGGKALPIGRNYRTHVHRRL